MGTTVLPATTEKPESVHRDEALSVEDWAKVEAMLDAYRPEIERLQRETHESQKNTARKIARIQATLAQIDAMLSK